MTAPPATGLVTIVVTGHRPAKLLGEDRTWVRAALRDALAGALARARAADLDLQLVSGMALGTDQWAAEAALDLGARLHAVLPFAGQDDRWGNADRRAYARLLGHERTASVLLHSSRPHDAGEATALLQARNGRMARIAATAAQAGRGEALVAWNGDRDGGTAGMVRILRALDLPALRLCPRAHAVMHLDAPAPLHGLRWLLPPSSEVTPS